MVYLLSLYWLRHLAEPHHHHMAACANLSRQVLAVVESRAEVGFRRWETL